MLARLKGLEMGADGRQVLSLTLIGTDFRDQWDALKDVELDLTLKKHREKRSRNANAYMWVLCEAIAQNQGITKVEVYRKQIREVGVCEVLTIREDALQRFAEAWCERGLGWFVDIADDAPDGKQVLAYYGTSCYTTTELSRVINGLVEDCRALGIETATPEELSLLMEAYEEHRSKRI
jgi:hypothetical protein